MVSPEKQIFKCFGCGKVGSVFDFLMEMEGLEFPEALRILADRAGVQLQRYDKKEYQIEKDQKSKLYEINHLSSEVFHKILVAKPKAQFVRDYLKKRQINEKSIKEFQLGYAPDQQNLLSNILLSHGHSLLDAEKAGLVTSGHDRFRDRLMFPITDTLGNIIAFTGRAMHETTAGKYVNSPDSPIFSKSRVLYALDKAKQYIKEKKQAILVEGQTDVIAAHQHGYKNVLASSGTALTPYQLEILNRFTQNIAFCFDRDSAGEEATKRAIDLAYQMGFDVKVILLPSGKDPDEILRDSPEIFEKALKNQTGALDFYFEITFTKYKKDLGPSEEKEIARELLSAIKNLSDSVVRAHYIQKLAEKLGTPEKYLYEALENVRLSKSISSSKPLKPSVKKDTLEERLLGLIFAHPDFIKEFVKKVNINEFKEDKTAEIAKTIKKYYNENAVFNVNSFKKKNPSFAKQIDFLILPYEGVADDDILRQEFNEYISRLSGAQLEDIKQSYEAKIKEAEKSKDKEKVKKLIQEFQKKVIGK